MEANAIEEHLKQVEESLEEVKHEEQEERGWLAYVSLSTAIIAILTALAGLYESQVTSKTILSKNDAVLFQSKISDQWSFYQAKSVKSHIYEIDAQLYPQKAEDFTKMVAKYDKDKQEIKAEAKKLEEERDAKLEESEHYYHKHHIVSFAITFLQVSIAIASISALNRSRKFWFLSLGLGAIGSIILVASFLA